MRLISISTRQFWRREPAGTKVQAGDYATPTKNPVKQNLKFELLIWAIETRTNLTVIGQTKDGPLGPRTKKGRPFWFSGFHRWDEEYKNRQDLILKKQKQAVAIRLPNLPNSHVSSPKKILG